MKNKRQNHIVILFDKFSAIVTRATGSAFAFLVAVILLLVLLLLGAFFSFSQHWQLIINTGTTMITFLMVFIIQQSQNKDTMALQLKLNELIAANKFASNKMVGIENLTPEELKNIKDFYSNLTKLVEKEKDTFATHSVGEADVKVKGEKEKPKAGAK